MTRSGTNTFLRTLLLMITLFQCGRALSTGVKTFALRHAAHGTRGPGHATVALFCSSSSSSSTLGRPSSAGISLDTQLIASDPELVRRHLQSRRASAEVLRSVETITALRTRRNELIQVGDKAKQQRKLLSQQIAIVIDFPPYTVTSMVQTCLSKL